MPDSCTNVEAGGKHLVDELVALGVAHPLVTGGQVDGHDMQAFGIDCGLELLPIV